MARAYIKHLANTIVICDEAILFESVNSIYRIVAIELYYQEDLLGWYEISEMVDRLHYDSGPLDFNKQDIISKIHEEAKKL